ncbi:Arginine decarboxylase protein [Dioscorea alata]|uniref:Arginine decarboxylase protein n=1 Tax=Dioscorea alata TaxID=55571 RepID=A0ACB7UTZ5_DIOAL|nr:Arginine decarboxylase protein [Dioscorea alata]
MPIFVPMRTHPSLGSAVPVDGSAASSLRNITKLLPTITRSIGTWIPDKALHRVESVEGDTRKHGSAPLITERISSADTPVTGCLPTAQLASAPLLQALKISAEKDVACFHFPGHNRGKAIPQLMSQLIGPETFRYDLAAIPELKGLFSPYGVISDAQKRAAELFGSSETWFLVGGTTCGVQASIMATCAPGETLILPRNSHYSAISGLILSGAIPKYIIPEYNSQWDIPGGITALQVEKAIEELKEDGKTAAAVLITSPTYHGICSNVREIAKLCHSHCIPVIVDEAHGAHFRFHPEFPSTALEQGADLAVQSTHKVLNSMTQSSMLHMSGNLVDRETVSRCLQTLQSTSPNYLLLASLDAARAQLSENPLGIFNKAMDLSLEAKGKISRIPGISILNLPSFTSGFPDIDPLRLTLGVSQLQISGYMADDILERKLNIYCELQGSQSITFAINLGTQRECIERLVFGMNHISATFYQKRNQLGRNADKVRAPFVDITMKLSPREAFFSKKRKASIGESLGQVCGELVCSYPPGIPVLIPGEVLTEKVLLYLLDVKKMGAAISGAADHQLNSIVVCNV